MHNAGFMKSYNHNLQGSLKASSGDMDSQLVGKNALTSVSRKNMVGPVFLVGWHPVVDNYEASMEV